MSDESHLASVEPLADMHSDVGRALWSMVETRRRTLNYIDGIAQAALDFEPPGQRHSVATLLYHIAVFEVDWLYVDIFGHGYDMERRIPECPAEIAAHLPYEMLTEDDGYTPVSGEPMEKHLERLSVIRNDFLGKVGAMTLEEFRTPRPSGGEMITPEWVVEHLTQHEAEHRGQIWEARVAAEAALGA